MNLPNLGLTPDYNTTAEQGAASALSLRYNEELAAALADVAGGATIDLADTYYFLGGVVNNGPAYGFTNTTSACWTGTFTGGPSSGTLCGTTLAEQDQYLFWDGVHPTAAAHQLIADAALDAIPEPSTWAMLALGFAGLGALGARKAGRVAKAA